MEIRFLFFSFFIFFLLSCEENDSFYFDSVNGSDQNPGSKELPFRSIEKINDINLKNNSHIYLSNGSLFKGSIKLLNKRNIMITNYNEEEGELLILFGVGDTQYFSTEIRKENSNNNYKIYPSSYSSLSIINSISNMISSSIPNTRWNRIFNMDIFISSYYKKSNILSIR